MRATDGAGNTDQSAATRSWTVAAPPPPPPPPPPAAPYADAVLATAGLRHYWRIGETSGSSLTDSKGGVAANVAGASLGVPGALAGD